MYSILIIRKIINFDLKICKEIIFKIILHSKSGSVYVSEYLFLPL